MKISILIPVYNEEESLPYLKGAMEDLFKKMPEEDFEIILVNDGSSDGSLQLIKEYAEKDSHFKYISFSRNFGKESAMMAGMSYSWGDIVGIMDADLQHPPEMIPEMIRAVKEEGYDVAATRRKERDESTKSYNRWARAFYKIINKFSSDIHIEEGAQDFRFMKRPVVEALLSLGETNRFSKGLFAWVGFKTKWFEAQDKPRVAGKTKWNFMKSFSYALDGIISFSTVPLKLSFFLGLIASMIGFIYAIVIIVQTLIMGRTVPGYASLMCVILILSGIILLILGIIGEYISRIYGEAKRRPHYIVKEDSFDEKYKRIN